MRTLELAIRFHGECKKLNVKYYLKDQIERSSSSVALNLSEGNYRRTSKDRRRFFQISYASLKETQTALRLMDEPPQSLLHLADHIGASLYRLIKNMPS